MGVRKSGPGTWPAGEYLQDAVISICPGHRKTLRDLTSMATVLEVNSENQEVIDKSYGKKK